ncbi:restriction endonuclease subunit S, partial [Rothia nasimurium]|uniref:restriction endonuclease subunit S n=1 Tax=Rothia nasimurium TaxID=85336 RepID=UPI001F0054C9
MSETKLLSDIATLQYGGAFSSKEFNVEGKGLPLVRIRDVQRGYSETYFDGIYDEKYIVSDGDFLISMDGNFNLGQWQGGKALLNQRICLIRDTSDEVDLRYLVAILPRYLAEIEARTPFVTVKHLSAKALNAIKIPIPDLQEQKRIADQYFLQKLIKQKRERQQELFKELKSAVFHDLFGAYNENMVKLGEVADITSGITKGRKTSQATREVPYLAVANVQAGSLKLDNVKTIEATEAEIEKYRLQKGDLVLTEGGDPDKLGRGAVWNDELPEAIHQNHIFRVRLHANSGLTPEFVEGYLSDPRARKYFLRSSKQTTGIASINKTQLSTLFIPIPQSNCMKKFV